MRVALAAVFATLVLGGAAAAQGRAGDFDFYVLALSWSPTYCEERGARADRTQCGAQKSYGFVLHGLWPQYERGFPSDCRVSGREPTRAQVESMLDLTPSPGLIRHEWRKHGTCSGLDPASYFATARKAIGKVTIPTAFTTAERDIVTSPADVERAFIAANRGLQASMIAVDCGRKNLNEVRICMTKDLAFRPCAEVDRRSCRLERVTMPPVGEP